MDWPPKKLNKAQAFYVKWLRCGDNNKTRCSWRRIAELFAQRYNGTWGDNQLAGQDLCCSAAEYFNENYNEEPWN